MSNFGIKNLAAPIYFYLKFIVAVTINVWMY